MKHKHAELIKAWADGAEIEYKSKFFNIWLLFNGNKDSWVDDYEYRIKPESKPEPKKRTMHLYFVGKNEQKFWISEEPPETYIYKNISQYIGSIEVLK